ncbi:hypothetical protein EYF80_039581 [Liparis tanakae]|uniref:Uncharacterized protein n=1 Tax=Liparis tanakae TaxID=230148 RepID=A0A4Z2G9N5_9TELE|nr:hypothetical protein EYF80_039581 [Liparis tanakae]
MSVHSGMEMGWQKPCSGIEMPRSPPPPPPYCPLTRRSPAFRNSADSRKVSPARRSLWTYQKGGWDAEAALLDTPSTPYANKGFIVLKRSDGLRTDVGFRSLGIKEHQGVPLGKQMELVGGFCVEDLAGVASCWLSF